MKVWDSRCAVGLAAMALVACGGGGGGASAPGVAAVVEPRFETSQSTLDAAYQCTAFTHPERAPVLLVHGTGTNAFEQWAWTYLPLLDERGFDVCVVTYPDRGLIDQQISAEYIVNALRQIHERSGRKVAMVGHSQGASMPRWALKWWPSARDAVEDFVLLAGPVHGTSVAAGLDNLELAGTANLVSEALWQFAPGSAFVAAVNRDDETPGEIDYTSIYTVFDELVQPVIPVPTAALDRGLNNPRVSNILLQDVCPGRFVDHVTIGLTDRLTFELVLDAISNAGPADVERAGSASGLCGLLDIVPDQIVPAPEILTFIDILQRSVSAGAPDPHLVAQEPALKDYARP